VGALMTGWAGVYCVRRRSAHDVNGTFKEGPNAGGGGWCPYHTPEGGGGTGTSRPTGDTGREGELLHQHG